VSEYVDHAVSGANGRGKRPYFDRLLKGAPRIRRYRDMVGRSPWPFTPNSDASCIVHRYLSAADVC
jgi:hypothetical protein